VQCITYHFNVTIRRLSFFFARSVLRSFGVPPASPILILGHMRSGSTLLLHILLTTPEVIGCGERNAAYRSREDFDKLEIAARVAQRAPFRKVRYTVDQINHDRFTPAPELLRDERVRCIFLIRDPRETIQSLVDLTTKFYEAWTVQQAVDYYVRRLESLTSYAAVLQDRHEALTYNDLVGNTSTVLRRLESSLGLEGKLREDYSIQKFTGKRGDPSEAIQLGRIVRNQKMSSIQIPNVEMDRALEAYQACARAIRL
jgi:Sulfotransferase family